MMKHLFWVTPLAKVDTKVLKKYSHYTPEHSQTELNLAASWHISKHILGVRGLGRLVMMVVGTSPQAMMQLAAMTQ